MLHYKDPKVVKCLFKYGLGRGCIMNESLATKKPLPALK